MYQRFDYDAVTGSFSNKRVAVSVPTETGSCVINKVFLLLLLLLLLLNVAGFCSRCLYIVEVAIAAAVVVLFIAYQFICPPLNIIIIVFGLSNCVAIQVTPTGWPLTAKATFGWHSGPAVVSSAITLRRVVS